MLVYAYMAGHGCADLQQYFLLNEANLNTAMFPIEFKLRKLSEIGKGNCFVFAIYDICR